MAGLADRGVSPTVVDDQIGRPTFTADLAAGIAHLLAHPGAVRHLQPDQRRRPGLLGRRRRRGLRGPRPLGRRRRADQHRGVLRRQAAGRGPAAEQRARPVEDHRDRLPAPRLARRRSRSTSPPDGARGTGAPRGSDTTISVTGWSRSGPDLPMITACGGSGSSGDWSSGWSSRPLWRCVIGRGIRLADRRSPGTGVALTTADLPDASSPQPRPAVRRRAIPLPPSASRWPRPPWRSRPAASSSGSPAPPGRPPQLLSMDAPFSLPRLFVAAALRRGRVRGRRRGRPHARPPHAGGWPSPSSPAASPRSRPAAPCTPTPSAPCTTPSAPARPSLLSALAAAVVVAGLWSFTRTERRDRRRVLGTLGFYAVASVGLSAVSGRRRPAAGR